MSGQHRSNQESALEINTKKNNVAKSGAKLNAVQKAGKYNTAEGSKERVALHKFRAERSLAGIDKEGRDFIYNMVPYLAVGLKPANNIGAAVQIRQNAIVEKMLHTAQHYH